MNHRNAVVTVTVVLLAAFAVSLLPGCQEKFTRDRWDMVKVGVYKKDDVKHLLGAPQQEPFGDLWWYYKGDNEAKIYYDTDGAVKAKKWFDKTTGKMTAVPDGWIDK